jgi:hypothetical protein
MLCPLTFLFLAHPKRYKGKCGAVESFPSCPPVLTPCLKYLPRLLIDLPKATAEEFIRILMNNKKMGSIFSKTRSKRDVAWINFGQRLCVFF